MAGIEATGYDVLCDRKILKAGDDWHPQIAQWMQRCHAAVILLDATSLESKYVRHEVSVLGDRRVRRPQDLFLLPFILDGGLKRGEVAGAFSPARLGDLHILALPNEIAQTEAYNLAHAADVPSLILEELVRRIPHPDFSGNAFDRMIEELERGLKELDSDVLEYVYTLQDLGCGDTLATASNELRGRSLAEWLVDLAPELGGVDRIVRLAGAMANELRRKGEVGATVYDVVAAAEARWLGDRPNDPFERMTFAPANPQCIAVSGSRLYEYALRCLAHRAWMRDRVFEIIPHHAELTVAAVDATLVAYFRRRFADDIDPEDITPEEVDDLASGSIVYLCLLPPPSPVGADDPLFAELGRNYRNVTFVGSLGPSAPIALPEGVCSVQPPLDDVTVKLRSNALRKLRATLNPALGR